MQTPNNLLKHRLICLISLVITSASVTQFFYPISKIGLSEWLMASLQVMGGMLAFLFHSIVGGHIMEHHVMTLIGLGIPAVLFAIHLRNKSLITLYLGTFFWFFSGFISVIGFSV